jgi:hypothetical protein
MLQAAVITGRAICALIDHRNGQPGPPAGGQLYDT